MKKQINNAAFIRAPGLYLYAFRFIPSVVKDPMSSQILRSTVLPDLE
jgi:hypothetical protein